MVTIEFNQQHVPQLCTCEGHQKVFHNRPDSKVYPSLKEGIAEIAKWNTMGGCWQYVVKAIK